MDPRLSAEMSVMTWYNTNFYKTFKGTNFFDDGVETMHFIGRHRRPKISPLLPNPDYLPVYPNKNNDFYQRNSEPMQNLYPQLKKRFNLPKLYQRKHQVNNIICCQTSKICNIADALSSVGKVFFENVTLNTTKNNLLQSITEVDKEIKKVEHEISVCKKKQHEFEETAEKSLLDKKEKYFCYAHYILFKNIYAENKLKVHGAHNILTGLGPEIDFPLYNQPSDASNYLENKKKHSYFKERLLAFLKKKFTKKMRIQKRLLKVYSCLAYKWKNSIMKIENTRKYRKAEAKKREYFETIFPDLHKQKDFKVFNNRISDYVRSEADFQEILGKLQLENLEKKMIKSRTVVPPLLFISEQRNILYVNRSNQIRDIVAENKANEMLNIWTSAEKEIFKEKFIQHSKNFGIIASYLEKKSISDCVKFYYLTKKTENYKQFLSKKKKHVSTNSQM